MIEIGVDFELNFTAVTRTFVCLFHAYNVQAQRPPPGTPPAATDAREIPQAKLTPANFRRAPRPKISSFHTCSRMRPDVLSGKLKALSLRWLQVWVTQQGRRPKAPLNPCARRTIRSSVSDFGGNSCNRRSAESYPRSRTASCPRLVYCRR